MRDSLIPVSRDGQLVGNFPRRQIARMLTEGTLKPTDSYYDEESGESARPLTELADAAPSRGRGVSNAVLAGMCSLGGGFLAVLISVVMSTGLESGSIAAGLRLEMQAGFPLAPTGFAIGFVIGICIAGLRSLFRMRKMEQRDLAAKAGRIGRPSTEKIRPHPTSSDR